MPDSKTDYPAAASAPPRRQAVAVIALGSLAMVVASLQPLLLSELAGAGRLPIGLVLPAALAETLAMAATVAICGLLLKPEHLRRAGIAAALVSLLACLAGLWARDMTFLPLRAVGGAAGGVLVWITIGMLARRARAEAWAAGFFLAQSAGQVFASALVAAGLAPRFGPGGGVILAAALAGLAAVTALAIPRAYPDLRQPLGGRLPVRRGLVTLAALFLYFAGAGAVWNQMGPLAQAQGLTGVSGMVVLVTLGAQMAGAVIAMEGAERIGRRTLFAGVSLLTLASYGLLALKPAAPLFVAAYGVAALCGLVLGASLFSLLNAADPSRRAAAVSASAQLAAAALGPMAGMALAALLGPRGGLLAAAALVVLSLAVQAWRPRPDGSASPDCA